MSGLTKIELGAATFDQLLEFADVAGLEIPDAHRSDTEKGIAGLRRLLTSAGYERGIFVAPTPLEISAPEIVHAPVHAYDPDHERWAHLMLNPDNETAMENEVKAPAFCSVNADTIYVPYSQQVVIREVFYEHFRMARERRWRQEVGEDGQMKKRRVPYFVDRYPMSFYGFVGYVADGVPDICQRDDVLLIAPDIGEQSAFARSQERPPDLAAIPA